MKDYMKINRCYDTHIVNLKRVNQRVYTAKTILSKKNQVKEHEEWKAGEKREMESSGVNNDGYIWSIK